LSSWTSGPIEDIRESRAVDPADARRNTGVTGALYLAEMALGLPPRAYTDAEWLAREHELLFEQSWSLVASVEELAPPGAVVSASVGRHPLTVERVGEDRLVAFVESDADAGAPVPAAVDVWEGLVFAHPDPSASPLSQTLGDLPANIGTFEPGRLTEVARCPIEGRFNWKLFVENHIDLLAVLA